MAAKRSPVLGYNHNFKHRGLVFHVQTEDSGVDNPHLFTHLFHGGVIISSRRMDYDDASEVDVVKSLMQSQHKAVLKDLKIGAFDDKIDAYLGNNPELQPRKDGSVGSRPDTTPDAGPPPSAEAPAPEAPPPEETPSLVNDAIQQVGIPLDPVAQTERQRIPTPISVPVTGVDEVGEPMVTFNSAAPAQPRRPNNDSGSYSIARKRPTTQTPVRPGTATRTSGRPRPGGKAANPRPGQPRTSSVVVSRPAVIIGSPAKTVGKDRPQKAPPARKARGGGGLFSKDTVSEKSLDEVIMAYLSEDGSEE